MEEAKRAARKYYQTNKNASRRAVKEYAKGLNDNEEFIKAFFKEWFNCVVREKSSAADVARIWPDDKGY